MTSKKFGSAEISRYLVTENYFESSITPTEATGDCVTAQISFLFPELLVNYKKSQILSGIIPKFNLWSFSKEAVGVDMIASEQLPHQDLCSARGSFSF